MEIFLRRPTKTTPYVHLDKSTHTFVIAGRSIPIDAEVFYTPILNWITALGEENDIKKIEFCFRFDFFNIASSKRVLFILYKLAELQKKGIVISIRWMYEKVDEDMLEIGQDYAVMIDKLSFVFESFDAETMMQEQLALKIG